MNKALILLLAMSSVLIPLPSQAQQEGGATSPAAQEKAAQEKAIAGQPTTAFLGGYLAERQASLPESVSVKPEIRKKLAETRVNLTLDGETSETALQKLLEASRCSYEYDPAFYRAGANTISVFGGTAGGGRGNSMDLPPRSITMKMVNASLPKALDTLTQAIGIGWTAEEDEGSITIRIVKLRTTRTTYDAAFSRLTPYGQSPAIAYDGAVANFQSALTTAGGSGSAYTVFFNQAVPNTRVKLDAKNWSVRDALKQVLQDAKIDFAIDEDVSSDLKRNLGFENVLLGTALDVICQSSDIGWRSETTSKGILVRVSKRYARSTDAVKVADPVTGTTVIK